MTNPEDVVQVRIMRDGAWHGLGFPLWDEGVPITPELFDKYMAQLALAAGDFYRESVGAP